MKISNIYLLLLAVFVITACDPLKDINAELDANPTAIIVDLDFVLSEDDYALSGNENAGDFGNFSTEDDAKEGIPNILAEKYPALGNGSSAIVGYDLYAPKQRQKIQFIYEVTTADYDALGHNFGNFSSFSDITEFLDWKYPSLESYEDVPQTFPSPSNGDLVFLEYKYWAPGLQYLKDGFIYTSNGWEQTSGFTDDEYTAMGENYANFSSDDEAELKIPIFLKQKYLYSPREAGDIESFTYGLYKSGTVYGTLIRYIYDGMDWNIYSNTIQQVLQLGNIDGQWVPDNTIKYTMNGADYDLVMTNYATINAEGVASMAQYGNYDLRIWSDEEITNSIADVLANNFASADEGQKYLVTYSVYTGSANETPTKHYIKTDGDYVIVAE